MKRHNNEAIVKFMTRTFKDKDWNELTVNVVRNEPKHVLVEITQECERPKLGLPKLNEVAKFFGSTNVDEYYDISRQGCETCDYGSSYGFALRIWED